MADYQSRKVLVFSGINDIPIAPSATSGGNISHLYDLYNGLIDFIQADITALENTTVTDYSTDISNLQSTIASLQLDVTNLNNNITTNNSTIVSNTNDINANSTAIANINTELTTINSTITTNKNNADTQFVTVNSSITTNGNNISTNTTNINSLNSDLTSLQTTVGNNSTNINTTNTTIASIQTDITNLQSNSGLITETFADNLVFFLDTVNGADNNDGLSNSTPFLTLDKLISVLITKHLPNNLTIAIKGTINQTIDLSGVSTLINRKGKLNRAKITFTTFDTGNFIINHNGTLIKTNNNYPLFIEFNNCSFLANNDSLNIINSNSFFDFVQPCDFETTATNTNSILYFENTDIELSTFGTDIIFNNSNNAALECAIKLVDCKSFFRKLTINDINKAVIADNSFVHYTGNSFVRNNSAIDIEATNNTILKGNRYFEFASDIITIDSSSNFSGLQRLDVAYVNPPLNIIIKILNNADKDYYVLIGGISGIFDNPQVTYYADNGDLTTQNNIINKGQDLGVGFIGSTSITYISLIITIFEYE